MLRVTMEQGEKTLKEQLGSTLQIMSTLYICRDDLVEEANKNGYVIPQELCGSMREGALISSVSLEQIGWLVVI